VRAYLFSVERLVQWVFARSNIHGALVMLYRNSMGFGTGALWIDEDDQDVIRAYVFPTGQYGLAASARQRIDTIGREFPMTVRQCVQLFGVSDRFSDRLKKLIEQRQWNQKITMLHFVCPNEDIDRSALDGREKPWTSHWLEADTDTDQEPIRSVGYRQFPAMIGRWEVNSSDDVYGYGPMYEALPDVKQLQHTEDQKLALLDKTVAPPLNVPGSLRAEFPSIMSGALNVIPDVGGAKVEPTYAPDVRAYELASLECRELANRIRESLHEDLWRLLTVSQDQQRPPGMTATEVVERHEEKLILLGPVVDRFHNDVLGPLIKRTIAILSEKDLLPPPPRELVEALIKGEDVRIEYISVLAQAQRLLGLGSLERFASIATLLAQTDPTVWDKVDRDEMLDLSADMLGIPPSAVRSDESVYDIRSSRARQQQAMAQAQQGEINAKTAQSLGNTPVGGDSALSRLLQTYGPAAEGSIPTPPGQGALA